MPKFLERELATLERERARLERDYRGKYVLVHGNEVIGAYDDFDTAEGEGLGRFPPNQFLIRQIGHDRAKLSSRVIYGLSTG